MAARRGWRASRWGSLLWSWDFLTAVPVGLAVGMVVALSPTVASSYQGVLLGISGIAAAFAALVLAIVPVLLWSLTGPYAALLKQTQGGIPGTLVPFQQTAKIALAASASAVVVAVAWPLRVHVDRVWERGILGMAAGLPMLLFLWALFASYMLISLVQAHLDYQQGAEGGAELRAEAIRRLQQPPSVPE